MVNLVSVIIPIVEVEYFKVSLESICKQSYQNIEIIIVDSSLNKCEVKKIISQMDDKRIIYFHQEKSGVANALNFGISKARGKYIARMDADDVAFPERISKLVSFMESHLDYDMIASSYMLIDSKGRYIKYEIKQFLDNEIKFELLFDNPICHPTVMFRRKIFDGGWLYRNVFSEDYDLWTRLSIVCKIAVLPDVLLKYRIHENNLSIMGAMKANESDTSSTLNYVKNWLGFHIDENKRWMLAKNYHLSFLTEGVTGKSSELLIFQYELLCCLLKNMKLLDNKSEKYLNKIILRRWKNIVDMSNLLYPSKDLYRFPLELKEQQTFEIDLLCDIQKNQRLIKKIKGKAVDFFLYGYGERGHRTLELFKELKKAELSHWTLLGIVDKIRKSYCLNGEVYETIDKEEIAAKEFDFVLVSAFDYFREVKDELISLKIPEDKIIRDNVIFFPN